VEVKAFVPESPNERNNDFGEWPMETAFQALVNREIAQPRRLSDMCCEKLPQIN